VREYFALLRYQYGFGGSTRQKIIHKISTALCHTFGRFKSKPS